jgi:hypothetical protein
MDTGVLDFFNKKLIMDYYFYLKSGPVFLFQIFTIAPKLENVQIEAARIVTGELS